MELLLCIIVYECVLAMQTIHIHKCIYSYVRCHFKRDKHFICIIFSSFLLVCYSFGWMWLELVFVVVLSLPKNGSEEQ